MPSIEWNKERWPGRLKEFDGPGHWGDQWGNGLAFISYVGSVDNKVVLEVGPGTGRITRHMLEAKLLILVDLNSVFLDYCLDRFEEEAVPMIGIETAGCKMAAVKSGIVDLVVSCGVFVHLDPDTFRGYLAEFSRVVRPGGTIVFDYMEIGDDQKKWFSYYDSSAVKGWLSEVDIELVESNRSGRATTIRARKKELIVGEERMMKHFAYEHLSDPLASVSKMFHDLAVQICENIDPGPERTVALRKLVESKDCAVRAKLHPGG